MEDKITICIVSREDVKESSSLFENLEQTCGNVRLDIRFFTNPQGVSLTSIYNKALEESENEIIVFMHDDIEMIDTNWGEELVRMFKEHEEYGIIGVAGTKQFNEDCTWWKSSKKYGQVLHQQEDKVWLTCFSDAFEEDLQEVCVIDGLFMAVNKNRITHRFDEDFQGFNHYDTSFCLSNYIDKATKIGVTMKVRLKHKSIGEVKPNWYANRTLLVQKYKDYFPIEVK